MRISPSHTFQGYDEGTCRLHATAKCFINNVVCKIQPKKFEFDPSCNRFLMTEEPQFKGLSEECSSSGYFKIIWFWMIFEALRRVKDFDTDLKPGNVDYIMSKLDSSFKRSRIPFEHQQNGRVMFEKFKKCVESYDVIYYHFASSFEGSIYTMLPTVTKRVFSFCLRQKLYIQLTVKTVDLGLGHAVVLVAEDSTHYYIKNSWKDVVTKVSKTEMFEVFELEGEKFRGSYFSLYLTYKKGEGVKTAPLLGNRFVDENMFFIFKYQKWLDVHKKYKMPHACVERELRTRRNRK